MIKSSNTGPVMRAAWVLLFLTLGPIWSQSLQAQHGHPLVGTWSGFMNRDGGGQPVRALFQFSFSADQVISGGLIANGRRYPFTSAELNPDNWTVTIEAQGQDRAGNTLTWRMNGAIENLDSPTQRTIAGTWREGGNGGDFRIVIN